MHSYRPEPYKHDTKGYGKEDPCGPNVCVETDEQVCGEDGGYNHGL
jgi:hypothetical protein